MIAKKARLISVPWDGYLKRLRPSSRFIKYRQNMFASSMKRRLDFVSSTASSTTTPTNTPPQPLSSPSQNDDEQQAVEQQAVEQQAVEQQAVEQDQEEE
jgi:glycerol-3-phosphate O-acyltransferase 3/4